MVPLYTQWLTVGHVESEELDRQQIVDHRWQVRMDVGGCARIRMRHHGRLFAINRHCVLLTQRYLVIVHAGLLCLEPPDHNSRATIADAATTLRLTGADNQMAQSAVNSGGATSGRAGSDDLAGRSTALAPPCPLLLNSSKIGGSYRLKSCTIRQDSGWPDLAWGFSDLNMIWLLYCAGAVTGCEVIWFHNFFAF